MSDDKSESTVQTRTACVIANATPDQVVAVGVHPRIAVRANRLGTLVTGRPGDLVIDYASELPGPVYDIMWNAQTRWFSVTIFNGVGPPKRWDNRDPSSNPGYTRVPDILGASTPMAILAVLDVPPEAIGYLERSLGT